MKTSNLDALLLLIIVVAFLVAVQARATTDIKMAWDFRTNEWRTIEFLADQDKIKVYTTAEDITDLVFIRYVDGRNIYAIKDMK